MPCYHPIRMYRSAAPGNGGRFSYVFSATQGVYDRPLTVPCGQCVGCRLERSRQWAVRCLHEASLYQSNCFVTLTYNDESLPHGNTLVRSDVQKFIKRLRKKRSFRFFGCGEYGETTFRPHYHLCLFNVSFGDAKYWRTSASGSRCYRSAELEGVWGLGNTEFGDVTFESAAYAARYCVPKVTGDAAASHYNGRLPEFACMSLKPGIGTGWYDRFSSGVVDHDSVVVRGVECKPPRFYDKLLEARDPVRFLAVKAARVVASDERDVVMRVPEARPVRLAVKEEVAVSRLRKKEGVE